MPQIVAFFGCEEPVFLYDLAVCYVRGVAPQFPSLGGHDGVDYFCIKILDGNPCDVVVQSRSGIPALNNVLVWRDRVRLYVNVPCVAFGTSNI